MNLKNFCNHELQNLPEELKKDFEFLILEKLKISRLDLKSESLKLDESVVKILKTNIDELKSGKPLAYILKSQFFLGYEFYVDHRVLIPRPETEYMVDIILQTLQQKKDSSQAPNGSHLKDETESNSINNLNENFKNKVNFTTEQLVLDAGAGSGCIGISLLLKIPNLKCIFVENSKSAIEVIKINLEKFKISQERYLILEDINQLADKLNGLENNKLDLFVSNPPYIANDDPEVQDSVLKYEPHTALFCEEDGLYYLKNWSLIGLKHLKAKGFAIFEFGHGQENFLQTFAIQNKMNSEIINDQYDVPRFWKITP